MKEIFKSVAVFFEKESWPTNRIEGETACSMRFKGRHGEWTCVAQAYEEDRPFVFYSSCPVKASAETFPAVCELVSRLNYSMLCGNFEIGYLDGDIRFRTSIEMPGHDLEHLMIDRVVYNNVATMDMYLPAILDVVENAARPIDAISNALLVP